MKKQIFEKWLYNYRHIVALSITLLSIQIIKIVTIVNYAPPFQNKSIMSLCTVLWRSDDLYLRFIVIMNFIIKPIFIYYLVIFLINLKKRA